MGKKVERISYREEKGGRREMPVSIVHHCASLPPLRLCLAFATHGLYEEGDEKLMVHV